MPVSLPVIGGVYPPYNCLKRPLKTSVTPLRIKELTTCHLRGLAICGDCSCAAREDLSVDFLAQISPITAKALADPVSSRHGLCRVKAMHPAALKVKQIQVIDNERAIRRLARV